MKTGNVILTVVIWVIGSMLAIFFGLPALAMDMPEVCVLSFVILLISFIVGVIVLYKGRETTSQQTVPKPNRHCPKCGRDIPFDAVVCPYCQYDFK